MEAVKREEGRLEEVTLKMVRSEEVPGIEGAHDDSCRKLVPVLIASSTFMSDVTSV